MPRSSKYVYNPKTLMFERVSPKSEYVRWRLAGMISFLILLIGSSVYLIDQYLYTPVDRQIRDQNRLLKAELSILENQINVLEKKMGTLQSRDVNIYRAIYNVDPPQKRDPRGTDYKELLKLPNGKILHRLKTKMERLEELAETQMTSYQELNKLAKNRQDLIDAIPAIMPVANKKLRRMASGFGYRKDPFYHTTSFHAGMDFTAETGTEVYATGNGIIEKVQSDRWGYGNHIVIRHGYGYTTLYGHLSRFAIKSGTKVVRGQLIGYIGSTGRSTGPHLHYEVRYKNNPLNPAFFYRNDLTDEEYQEMLDQAQQESTRFD
jgi:murein DD-endopeptidase MepM/ murein hydrolase activator NlpD